MIEIVRRLSMHAEDEGDSPRDGCLGILIAVALGSILWCLVGFLVVWLVHIMG